MTDNELLQRYSEHHCESAFAELVNRYVNLVYSASLRQVGGNAHLAKDVTQSVFIDLARKAPSFSGNIVLTGWLYTSARFAAAKAIRSEQRWHAREQEAIKMLLDPSETPTGADTQQFNQVLDEVMHELKESDRNAILLRYFDGRQLSEVGERLGLNEDAARKKVTRAVDKLRHLLAARGVVSSTASVAALLSAQAVTAAPAGLAAQITGTALASATLASGSTLTALELISMTKLKVAAITTLVVASVATPLWIQHRSASALREENQALRKFNTELSAQVVPLVSENERLSNLLAQAESPAGSFQSSSNDLLRLRAEVSRLRSDAREVARARTGGLDDTAFEATVQELAARATQLKQRLDQMPEKQIPEIKFLSNKDWLEAVGNVKTWETDDDYRQALSNLRSMAKGRFGNMMQKALRRYTDENGGVLPAELSQLQPYFEGPVDPSLFGRYQLLQSGKLSDLRPDQMLIGEVATPVDSEFDTHFEFNMNGTTSSTRSATGEALNTAAEAYAQANNGQVPRSAEHLAPYLKEPVSPERVQQFLSHIPKNIATLDELKAESR